MDIITRKDAAELKLKRYFTGKPCKHGHISVRRTSDAACIECRKVSRCEYYRKYPEKQIIRDGSKEQKRKRNHRYYEKHKERISEYSIQYSENRLKVDPDYRKRNDKRYRDNHPERDATRRAQKLQATPVWYEDRKVNNLYRKRNELSELWNMQLHVDHIVPLQGKYVCGLHCWDNLQLLEASLNISKRNKFEE